MEDKDVVLVGFDIYSYVKEIFENFALGDKPGMSSEEKVAYKLGADSVLSLLSQVLNEMTGKNDDLYTDANYIAVHVPGLKTMEEFSVIDEILSEKLSNPNRGKRGKTKILEQRINGEYN